MNASRSLLLATVLSASGCLPADRPEGVAATNVVNPPPYPLSPQINAPVLFDFGVILANGQTFSHTFPLRNTGTTPLRIVGSNAETPCCSSIESLPDAVPPGSTASFSIQYRPGFQSGRKAAAFTIRTDAKDAPERRFVVLASLVAEVEVGTLEPSDRSLRIGQPGRQRARIVSRRIGGVGRPAPDSIVAPAPLAARFEGPATESTWPGGVNESVRVATIDLPGTATPGPRRESALIRWDGDRTWTLPLSWQVAPTLRASPATLILDPARGPSEFSVIVRSEDRPFRILSVVGPSVVANDPLPTKPDRTWSVRFKLDAARLTPGTSADVVLATDSSDQPTLDLKVVILPTGGETRHEKAP